MVTAYFKIELCEDLKVFDQKYFLGKYLKIFYNITRQKICGRSRKVTSTSTYTSEVPGRREEVEELLGA